MVSEDTAIIISLTDTLDYSEYVAACNRAGLTPQILGKFAQTAGMIAVAKRGGADVAEYMKMIAEMNAAYDTAPESSHTIAHEAQSRGGCRGCGGGKVR
jgi:hypothetical protein